MNADAWERLANALFPDNMFADETPPAERTVREDEGVIARLRERIAQEAAGLQTIQAAISGMGV